VVESNNNRDVLLIAGLGKIVVLDCQQDLIRRKIGEYLNHKKVGLGRGFFLYSRLIPNHEEF
jgi:hypothetical protein